MTMVGVDMAFPMIHTAKLKVPDGLVVTDAAKRDWFISPMGELEAVPIWWPFYEAPFPGKYFPYNFGHFPKISGKNYSENYIRTKFLQFNYICTLKSCESRIYVLVVDPVSVNYGRNGFIKSTPGSRSPALFRHCCSTSCFSSTPPFASKKAFLLLSTFCETLGDRVSML
jgi:hypothetical protein